MAKTALDIELEGLIELQRQMTEAVEALRGTAMLNAMRTATLWVQRNAMTGTVPVDTGRLRASITPRIMHIGPEIRGVVGSNVEYAPYQEFGFTTRAGTIKRGPRIGQPYTQTEVPGKFYFKKAFKDTLPAIKELFRDTIQAIFRRKQN